MFSKIRKIFGKREDCEAVKPPTTSVGGTNPSKGFRLRLSVKGPAGERYEDIDLVESLSRTLIGLGRECSAQGGVVRDGASGVEFRPGIVSFQPNDDLSMQICTTIGITYPGSSSSPFFEYQHSVGSTGSLAVAMGFEDWSKMDLPVVLDALRAKIETCTTLQFSFPNRKPRRVVLGPVSLWAPKQSPASTKNAGDTESHPPFCPCCLFSNSMEAFKAVVDSDRFVAVRLYAMRNADGTPASDCRVNGDDFLPGAAALVDYVRTWAGSGFEARKQYIIIQDQPAGAEAAQ